MRTATIQEVKQALATLKPAQVAALCLRLARFKKENKELLTYLLFEADNEAGYIQSVKMEIAAQFDGINHSSVYFIKKSLRKILRLINRYCRFSDADTTEVELHLCFCSLWKQHAIPLGKSKVLDNIYEGELKKINTLVKTLHEDLQYDYLRELEIMQTK